MYTDRMSKFPVYRLFYPTHLCVMNASGCTDEGKWSMITLLNCFCLQLVLCFIGESEVERKSSVCVSTKTDTALLISGVWLTNVSDAQLGMRR